MELFLYCFFSFTKITTTRIARTAIIPAAIRVKLAGCSSLGLFAASLALIVVIFVVFFQPVFSAVASIMYVPFCFSSRVVGRVSVFVVLFGFLGKFFIWFLTKSHFGYSQLLSV